MKIIQSGLSSDRRAMEAVSDKDPRMLSVHRLLCPTHDFYRPSMLPSRYTVGGRLVVMQMSWQVAPLIN